MRAGQRDQRLAPRIVGLVASLTLLLAIGGSASPSAGAVRAVNAPTGNVFVAPNGSDTGSSCTRSPKRRALPGKTSSVCASFGKAYQLARPGDIILVGRGSYGTQRVCRGGSPTCAEFAAEKGGAAVTFRAQSAHGAVVRGVLQLGNARDGGANPPSNLVFDGIDIEGQISETGDFNPSNPKGHDITFRNGHVWSVKSWPIPNQGLVEESQVDNLTLDHMDIGPGCCRGDAIYGGLANNDVARNFVIEDSVIHDLYDSCRYIPAGINSQYGPCNSTTNSGFGDGANYDHVDGVDLWGGNNLQLLRNRWYAIGANGDPVGQSIFLYADSTGNCGSFDGITIANNAVYAGNARNSTVSMGTSGGFACTPGLKNIKVLYNTIWASNSNGFGNLSIGDVAAGTSVIVAGNIIKSTAGNSSTCAVGVKGGGSLMPIFRNNLIANRTCDPSDHQGTPTFVRSDPLNPDQHLSQNGQWAISHGEQAYRPSVDLDGKLRPRRLRPDVGAYQLESALLSSTGQIGAVAIGMHERSVRQFYGLPRRASVRRTGLRSGNVRTVAYRLHGGSLLVSYRGSVVVGRRPASQYYSTPSGFGVGASAGSSLQWQRCRDARVRVAGGVATSARVSHNRVVAVTIARAPYVRC